MSASNQFGTSVVSGISTTKLLMPKSTPISLPRNVTWPEDGNARRTSSRIRSRITSLRWGSSKHAPKSMPSVTWPIIRTASGVRSDSV